MADRLRPAAAAITTPPWLTASDDSVRRERGRARSTTRKPSLCHTV